MSTRKNIPITAERLLNCILIRLLDVRNFFSKDLTALISTTQLRDGEDPRMIGLNSIGNDSGSWEGRLKTILSWTSIALREQRWLREQGLDPLASIACGVRRHGTMHTFIHQEGLPDKASTTHALQQGRKILRLEHAIGSSISLLLLPVLPEFRRLPSGEEFKFSEILRNGEFKEITNMAFKLCELRSNYQSAHEYHIGQKSCPQFPTFG